MKPHLPLAIAVMLSVGLAGCGPVAPPEPTLPPAPTATVIPTATVVVAPAAMSAAPVNGAAAPAAPVADAVDVVARVQSAVVTVVNSRNRGSFGNNRTLEAGRGTGFAIDQDGHIVTNEHVVRDGDAFEVILADGTSRPATLVGSDSQSDIAVVKIDGAPPATVGFGNSDELRPGQPVLAIGSPLGEFTGTVTEGIVSALNRDFPDVQATGEPAYSNLIQHDAPINPGNSGGPLFDLTGRVVGVNTLGIQQGPDGSPTQGLFFAIPSNFVARIVSQLIATGKVVYPFLGVEFAAITPDLASSYDLPVNFGAFVQRVSPGGPSEAAGIEDGDIITSIGGRALNAQTTFTEALFASAPGDTVDVVVLRNGREQTFPVRLGSR